MKTKEAIERVRSRFDKWALDEEDLEALHALGLVTIESEDERIRKRLVDCLKVSLKGAEEQDAAGCSRQKDIEAYKWGIAYFEKQKKSIEDVVKDITKNKEAAIKFLKSAGIMDDNGELAEMYRSEQKSTEIDNEETELSYFESVLFSAFSDGWQQYLHGEEVDVAQWAKEHSAELLNAAKLELKPAEWSDGDKDYYDAIIGKLEVTQDDAMLTDNQMDFLKSLPERFNLQPKQESEPMKIKYAGKIYKVYGTMEFPCGVIGYKIKDEPGQFDYIINPDEVLGGGYDIKSKETPYPAKEANLDQPHWKPSEEQMIALKKGIGYLAEYGRSDDDLVLNTLYDDLNKLYSL